MYKHLYRDINLMWTRTFEFEDIGKYLKKWKYGELQNRSSNAKFVA